LRRPNLGRRTKTRVKAMPYLSFAYIPEPEEMREAW
jgi:hypothetical protein